MPNLDCDCELKEMYFFKKFYGQASTVMFYNKMVNEEHFKVLKCFSSGIYSESKIYTFLKKTSTIYMSNSNITKRNFKEKDSEHFQQLYDSLRFFYSPCRYNKDVVFDIMNNVNAKIMDSGQEPSGVNKFICNQKDIFYLGGINCILPFIELIRKILQV